MTITELDTRTVKIIDSLLKLFLESNQGVYSQNKAYGILTSEIENLNTREIKDCFNLIEQLLDVGKSNQIKSIFIINKTKLNLYQNNGGIKQQYERLKSESILKQNLLTNNNELVGLQIQKLSNELDEKNLEFQKRLQAEQSDFFTTTTAKNKDQMLYIYIAIGTSLISLLLALLNYLK